jgi:hypothetical protein
VLPLFLVVLLSTACRLAPPSDDPKTWDGPLGEDPPLAHQGIELGTEVETGEAAPEDTAPGALGPPVVVVLVMDGARLDETLGHGMSSVTGEPTEAFLPLIRGDLVEQGTAFSRAVNTGVTITTEAHAELVTGRRSTVSNFPSDEGAGDYRPSTPTLFEVLRSSEGIGSSATLIGGNTSHLMGLTQTHHPLGGPELSAQYFYLTDPLSPGQPGNDDPEVINEVQRWMMANPARLIVANMHQMDRAGHYNENPVAYADRVKAVDGPLVEFWKWIQSSPEYRDRTTLFVLADHGRHRHGLESDFRQHGDACSGCREIPLLIIGPGVHAGASSDAPATLADVGATIAEILDLPLPLRTGRVLAEALVDPPGLASPQGDVQPGVAGTMTLTQRWQDDRSHRSSIVLNGVQISSARALHAEAPVLSAGTGLAVACWRELSLGEGEVEIWPWLPVCERTLADGSWTHFRFPFTPVSPYFRPSLLVDHSGQLWAAAVDNHTGNWEGLEQSVRVHRWNAADSWQEAGAGIETARAPMHTALVRTSDGVLLAFVGSDTIVADESSPSEADVHSRARYRRHLQIHRVRWPAAGTPTVYQLWRSYTADHHLPGAPLAAPGDSWEGWSGVGRVDRPALGQNDHIIQLAFLAMPAGGGPTTLMLQSSEDEGHSWTDPLILDTGGVVTHLSPVISAGAVYWARNGTDGVSICRWTASDETECEATGAQAIDGLSVTGNTWSAGLLEDDLWRVVSRPW